MRPREGDLPWRIGRYYSRLWEYTPQAAEPGAIFLPAVKTIVYTVRDPARLEVSGHWRRRRVEAILGALEFVDWTYHFGDSSEHYWSTIPRDHAAFMRAYDPPLLILEDDIELREFRPNLRPPAGCQVAYLGGFRSGDRRGLVAAAAAGIEFAEHCRYGYVPIDADWIRIFGMWGSHAILWLDKGAMLQAAGLWESRVEAIDTTLAREQWRWQVHCRRVPMFWQNDGHHFLDTYEYQP